MKIMEVGIIYTKIKTFYDTIPIYDSIIVDPSIVLTFYLPFVLF